MTPLGVILTLPGDFAVQGSDLPSEYRSMAATILSTYTDDDNPQFVDLLFQKLLSPDYDLSQPQPVYVLDVLVSVISHSSLVSFRPRNSSDLNELLQSSDGYHSSKGGKPTIDSVKTLARAFHIISLLTSPEDVVRLLRRGAYTAALSLIKSLMSSFELVERSMLVSEYYKTTLNLLFCGLTSIMVLYKLPNTNMLPLKSSTLVIYPSGMERRDLLSYIEASCVLLSIQFNVFQMMVSIQILCHSLLNSIPNDHSIMIGTISNIFVLSFSTFSFSRSLLYRCMSYYHFPEDIVMNVVQFFHPANSSRRKVGLLNVLSSPTGSAHVSLDAILNEVVLRQWLEDMLTYSLGNPLCLTVMAPQLSLCVTGYIPIDLAASLLTDYISALLKALRGPSLPISLKRYAVFSRVNSASADILLATWPIVVACNSEVSSASSHMFDLSGAFLALFEALVPTCWSIEHSHFLKKKCLEELITGSFPYVSEVKRGVYLLLLRSLASVLRTGRLLECPISLYVHQTPVLGSSRIRLLTRSQDRTENEDDLRLSRLPLYAGAFPKHWIYLDGSRSAALQVGFHTSSGRHFVGMPVWPGVSSTAKGFTVSLWILVQPVPSAGARVGVDSRLKSSAMDVFVSSNDPRTIPSSSIHQRHNASHSSRSERVDAADANILRKRIQIQELQPPQQLLYIGDGIRGIRLILQPQPRASSINVMASGESNGDGDEKRTEKSIPYVSYSYALQAQYTYHRHSPQTLVSDAAAENLHPGFWYHVVLTHGRPTVVSSTLMTLKRGIFGGTGGLSSGSGASEATIYVNGVLVASAHVRYPNFGANVSGVSLSEPFCPHTSLPHYSTQYTSNGGSSNNNSGSGSAGVKMIIGGTVSEDAVTMPLHGLVNAIALLDVPLSHAQIRGLFHLGPSYQPRFESADVSSSVINSCLRRAHRRSAHLQSRSSSLSSNNNVMGSATGGGRSKDIEDDPKQVLECVSELLDAKLSNRVFFAFVASPRLHAGIALPVAENEEFLKSSSANKSNRVSSSSHNTRVSGSVIASLLESLRPQVIAATPSSRSAAARETIARSLASVSSVALLRLLCSDLRLAPPVPGSFTDINQSSPDPDALVGLRLFLTRGVDCHSFPDLVDAGLVDLSDLLFASIFYANSNIRMKEMALSHSTIPPSNTNSASICVRNSNKQDLFAAEALIAVVELAQSGVKLVEQRWDSSDISLTPAFRAGNSSHIAPLGQLCPGTASSTGLCLCCGTSIVVPPSSSIPLKSQLDSGEMVTTEATNASRADSIEDTTTISTTNATSTTTTTTNAAEAGNRKEEGSLKKGKILTWDTHQADLVVAAVHCLPRNQLTAELASTLTAWAFSSIVGVPVASVQMSPISDAKFMKEKDGIDYQFEYMFDYGDTGAMNLAVAWEESLSTLLDSQFDPILVSINELLAPTINIDKHSLHQSLHKDNATMAHETILSNAHVNYVSQLLQSRLQSVPSRPSSAPTTRASSISSKSKCSTDDPYLQARLLSWMATLVRKGDVSPPKDTLFSTVILPTLSRSQSLLRLFSAKDTWRGDRTLHALVEGVFLQPHLWLDYGEDQSEWRNEDGNEISNESASGTVGRSFLGHLYALARTVPGALDYLRSTVQVDSLLGMLILAASSPTISTSSNYRFRSACASVSTIVSLIKLVLGVSPVYDTLAAQLSIQLCENDEQILDLRFRKSADSPALEEEGAGGIAGVPRLVQHHHETAITRAEATAFMRSLSIGLVRDLLQDNTPLFSLPFTRIPSNTPSPSLNTKGGGRDVDEKWNSSCCVEPLLRTMLDILLPSKASTTVFLFTLLDSLHSEQPSCLLDFPLSNSMRNEFALKANNFTNALISGSRYNILPDASPMTSSKSSSSVCRDTRSSSRDSSKKCSETLAESLPQYGSSADLLLLALLHPRESVVVLALRLLRLLMSAAAAEHIPLTCGLGMNNGESLFSLISTNSELRAFVLSALDSLSPLAQTEVASTALALRVLVGMSSAPRSFHPVLSVLTASSQAGRDDEDSSSDAPSYDSDEKREAFLQKPLLIQLLVLLQKAGLEAVERLHAFSEALVGNSAAGEDGLTAQLGLLQRLSQERRAAFETDLLAELNWANYPFRSSASSGMDGNADITARRVETGRHAAPEPQESYRAVKTLRDRVPIQYFRSQIFPTLSAVSPFVSRSFFDVFRPSRVSGLYSSALFRLPGAHSRLEQAWLLRNELLCKSSTLPISGPSMWDHVSDEGIVPLCPSCARLPRSQDILRAVKLVLCPVEGTETLESNTWSRYDIEFSEFFQRFCTILSEKPTGRRLLVAAMTTSLSASLDDDLIAEMTRSVESRLSSTIYGSSGLARNMTSLSSNTNASIGSDHTISNINSVPTEIYQNERGHLDFVNPLSNFPLSSIVSLFVDVLRLLGAVDKRSLGLLLSRIGSNTLLIPSGPLLPLCYPPLLVTPANGGGSWASLRRTWARFAPAYYYYPPVESVDGKVIEDGTVECKEKGFSMKELNGASILSQEEPPRHWMSSVFMLEGTKYRFLLVDDEKNSPKKIDLTSTITDTTNSIQSETGAVVAVEKDQTPPKRRRNSTPASTSTPNLSEFEIPQTPPLIALESPEDQLLAAPLSSGEGAALFLPSELSLLRSPAFQLDLSRSQKYDRGRSSSLQDADLASATRERRGSSMGVFSEDTPIMSDSPYSERKNSAISPRSRGLSSSALARTAMNNSFSKNIDLSSIPEKSRAPSVSSPFETSLRTSILSNSTNSGLTQNSGSIEDEALVAGLRLRSHSQLMVSQRKGLDSSSSSNLNLSVLGVSSLTAKSSSSLAKGEISHTSEVVPEPQRPESAAPGILDGSEGAEITPNVTGNTTHPQKENPNSITSSSSNIVERPLTGMNALLSTVDATGNYVRTNSGVEEAVVESYSVVLVRPFQCSGGTLYVTRHNIVFVPFPSKPSATTTATPSASTSTMSGSCGGQNLGIVPTRQELVQQLLPPPTQITIPIGRIASLERRRHNLRSCALEVYYAEGTDGLFSGDSELFGFSSSASRNAFVQTLHRCAPVHLAPYISEPVAAAADLAARWRARRISNFDYLSMLNRLAGRTYKDLSQYPIFPWVLSDYSSPVIDLDDPSVYRDLSRPVGAQSSSRRSALQTRFQFLREQEEEQEQEQEQGSGKGDGMFLGGAFHFGSCIMKQATVAWYLSRLEPFSAFQALCGDGRFERPDREFHSIAEAYRSSVSSDGDVKELVPEFFSDFSGSFLRNSGALLLGRKQSGSPVGDVVLPPWAASTVDFVRINRLALESPHVTARLHLWVDLVFGHKQRPQGLPGGSLAAELACNTFHSLMYAGFIDLEKLRKADPKLFHKVSVFLTEYGSLPPVLFPAPRGHDEAIRKALRKKYLALNSSESQEMEVDDSKFLALYDPSFDVNPLNPPAAGAQSLSGEAFPLFSRQNHSCEFCVRFSRVLGPSVPTGLYARYSRARTGLFGSFGIPFFSSSADNAVGSDLALSLPASPIRTVVSDESSGAKEKEDFIAEKERTYQSIALAESMRVRMRTQSLNRASFSTLTQRADSPISPPVTGRNESFSSFYSVSAPRESSVVTHLFPRLVPWPQLSPSLLSSHSIDAESSTGGDSSTGSTKIDLPPPALLPIAVHSAPIMYLHPLPGRSAMYTVCSARSIGVHKWTSSEEMLHLPPLQQGNSTNSGDSSEVSGFDGVALDHPTHYEEEILLGRNSFSTLTSVFTPDISASQNESKFYDYSPSTRSRSDVTDCPRYGSTAFHNALQGGKSTTAPSVAPKWQLELDSRLPAVEMTLRRLSDGAAGRLFASTPAARGHFATVGGAAAPAGTFNVQKVSPAAFRAIPISAAAAAVLMPIVTPHCNEEFFDARFRYFPPVVTPGSAFVIQMKISSGERPTLCDHLLPNEVSITNDDNSEQKNDTDIISKNNSEPIMDLTVDNYPESVLLPPLFLHESNPSTSKSSCLVPCESGSYWSICPTTAGAYASAGVPGRATIVMTGFSDDSIRVFASSGPGASADAGPRLSLVQQLLFPGKVTCLFISERPPPAVLCNATGLCSPLAAAAHGLIPLLHPRNPGLGSLRGVSSALAASPKALLPPVLICGTEDGVVMWVGLHPQGNRLQDSPCRSVRATSAPVCCVHALPAADTVAVGSLDGSVVLLGWSNPSKKVIINPYTYNTHCLNTDRTSQMKETVSGRKLRKPQNWSEKTKIGFVHISVGGTLIVHRQATDKDILEVYSLIGEPIANPVTLSMRPRAFCVSDDGSILLVGGEGSFIDVYDVHTLSRRAIIGVNGMSGSIGSRIRFGREIGALWGADENLILDENEQLPMPFPAPVTSITLTLHEKSLWCGLANGEVRIFTSESIPDLN